MTELKLPGKLSGEFESRVAEKGERERAFGEGFRCMAQNLLTGRIDTAEKMQELMEAVVPRIELAINGEVGRPIRYTDYSRSSQMSVDRDDFDDFRETGRPMMFYLPNTGGRLKKILRLRGESLEARISDPQATDESKKQMGLFGQLAEKSMSGIGGFETKRIGEEGVRVTKKA